jgi:Tol biopolymer transport system component
MTTEKKISLSFLFFLVSLSVLLLNGFFFTVLSNSINQSELFYDLFGKTFYADVYVRYPNGEIKKVSPSNNGIYYQPHISPDGDKVVFYGNESGPPRIWIADTISGNVTALTPETSGARHPVFSWDGSMIAFASDRQYQQHPEMIEYMCGNGLPPKDLVLNLFIMDDSGDRVRQITYGPYQDQRPAFSPDGKRIAFVSNRGGENRLWTVDIDGDMQLHALQESGWGYRPWYSADGRWIYFYSGLNKRHQICKIPAEGGQITALENDDIGTSHGPFADYDNEVLLIHSTRNGQFGIWELPLDGTQPRQIVLPGFENTAAHATRSKNGILAFDVYRQTFPRKIGSSIKSLVQR